MKNRLKKPCNFLAPDRLCIVLTALLLFGCGTKTSTETTAPPQAIAHTADYEVVEDKSSLATYYQLDHIKDWYPERILPPVFDYAQDLSNKSIVELWLLRNEIFARNGYLFDDAVLRGYFNQFKWYQPIFDVPEFKVQLDQQEQQFVNKVLALENTLNATRYTKQGDYTMVNLQHVYNVMQFKAIDETLKQALAKNNFALVPAKHEQFFHVYDRNSYEYIPNFITTDIYLQVMHKHFSALLQKIEEEKFIGLMGDLLKRAYDRSLQYEKDESSPTLKSSAQWATTYLAIALSALTEKTFAVSPGMTGAYQSELKKINDASETGSEFLGDPGFQYSQFTPRGNYTKTKELSRYFRAVKWLNTAPVMIDTDNGLMSAIVLSSSIQSSPETREAFEKFNKALLFIVGEEDNASVANIISLLPPHEELKNITQPERLSMLRGKLMGVGQGRIKSKGGDDATQKELSRPSIRFTAGRYTFDAEVLSRLIHVLRPEPKRPFPKALDFFAVLGNADAESILLNELKEGTHWTPYPDSLKKLKSEFKNYNTWDISVYSKTLDAIRAVSEKRPDYPLFMNTPLWQKKNINTSLAAYTELKHDLLLYAEQPTAAEAGEGGGPPPPEHVSYVEPNVAFWQKALDLLNLQEETLTRLDLMTDEVSSASKELKEIAEQLLAMSKKELAHENLTAEDFDYLTWLGGKIEYLTIRLSGNDHLPEKERLVAEIADVYNYNGTYLEEAVGTVDEIYVIAEINGKPYLTKGAVYSYYEFTSDTPLTDEAWQRRVTSGSTPARPTWMKEILVNAPSLESNPSYSF
ncbi:DUF3160 domain-containing protein [Chryseolinea serpens]|nr:DUF3160 domain-containing protein [Chryseolinea serpens]